MSGLCDHLRSVPRTCRQCRKKFVAFPTGKGFCSRKCAGAYKRSQFTTRFWGKIRKSRRCWEYTGGKCQGYGQVRDPASGKNFKAHRVSWAMANGPVPDGLCVCHKCDNPACVKPNHLFLGTKLANAQDRDRKKRRTPPQGSDVGTSKLKETDVEAIRQLYDEGYTQAEIGKQFNVSRSSVTLIVGMKTWKHV